MKLLGLIAEYNPFHNGHALHLKQSKEITNATHTIAVMSGNFVQRGMPAIVDKFSRAKMAVLAGVDLVIELPTLYSCQSAEIFSKGAVTLLNSLNCVDSLCFGSESGNVNLLRKISNILVEEPDEYRNDLRKYLNKGTVFPVARTNALLDYIQKSETGYKIFDNINIEKIKNAMSSSNNILAIEYIKSLINLKSNIRPYTIKRANSEYNSIQLTGEISSATAIRNQLIENKNLDNILRAIPKTTYDVIKEVLIDNNKLMNEDLFFDTLKIIIIREKAKLDLYFEVNEGIENRVYREVFKSNTMTELITRVKSKRYTETKIRRTLNNILLGITKEKIEAVKCIDKLPYIRILGFNNKGREILKEIKNKADVVMINKMSKIEYYYNDNKLKLLIENDIKSSGIYNSLYFSDVNNSIMEYSEKPFIKIK